MMVINDVITNVIINVDNEGCVGHNKCARSLISFKSSC